MENPIFLIDDLGVAYFRTPPYLNQSSLLYGWKTEDMWTP